MVKAGKYTDYIIFGEFDGGQNDKPIWLRSADGFGAAELVGIYQGMEAVRINGARHVVVEGFKLSGFVCIWEGPAPPGSPVDAYGAPAGNIVLQNNFIISSKTSGVVDVRHSQTVYVLGNEIQAGSMSAISLNDCVGCVVDGNAVSVPF
jgi:hypothetical protein